MKQVSGWLSTALVVSLLWNGLLYWENQRLQEDWQRIVDEWSAEGIANFNLEFEYKLLWEAYQKCSKDGAPSVEHDDASEGLSAYDMVTNMVTP